MEGAQSVLAEDSKYLTYNYLDYLALKPQSIFLFWFKPFVSGTNLTWYASGQNCALSIPQS